MGAKSMPKPNHQWVAIGRVTADLENVQSRAGMSKGHERKFSDLMLENGWGGFPPVVIFFDGKKYWLADGFHRYFAAKKAGLPAVHAEVRDGTKRDAIIHSAGSNIEFSIERTDEDKRRAVMLLLADHEWFQKSLVVISEHTKTGRAFVTKCRLEYCQQNKVELPDSMAIAPKIDFEANGIGKYRVSSSPRKGRPKALVHFKGKTVYLGLDGPEARAKYEAMKEMASGSFFALRLSDNTAMAKALQKRGLLFSGSWLSGIQFLPSCGGGGIVGHGCIVTVIKSEKWTDLMKAIGRVTFGSRAYPSPLRKVIICDEYQGIAHIIDIAKTIDGGIEFMTPEEFVADLKARGVSPSGDDPSTPTGE